MPSIHHCIHVQARLPFKPSVRFSTNQCAVHAGLAIDSHTAHAIVSRCERADGGIGAEKKTTLIVELVSIT